MSLYQGQFDDPADEAAEQHQLELARATGVAQASRLTAASRAAALGFAPTQAALAARAAAVDRATASRVDAASTYLSMLQNAGGAGAGDAASPYGAYQRQAYRPAYGLPSQNPYGGLPSAAEASLAYARRATASAYAGYPGASPDNGYAAAAAAYRPSPASARNLASSYYQRQDLSSAALLERYNNHLQGKQQQQPQNAAALKYLQQKQQQQQQHQQQQQQQQHQQQQHQQQQEQAAASLAASAASPEAASSAAANTGRSTSRRSGPGRGSSGRGGRGAGRGRGRGRGRGKAKQQQVASPAASSNAAASTTPSSVVSNKETVTDSEVGIGEDGQRWYSGCVPLGLPEDKYWLSELQVFLRSNFAESFGATEADIAAPMHGRNKPIALGQVGIRCIHCRDDPPSERGQQATSYPSLISGIYNSVQQMLRLHFDCCLSMPPEVRSKIEQLKVSSSARGGRKQYWIDSAKRLGLVDTPHGIHFGRDPYGELPPLSGPSGNEEQKIAKSKRMAAAKKEEKAEKEEAEKAAPVDVPEVEYYPLVMPEDKALISDYLYLTLEQMAPCNLMEADKVGCYKSRNVGFPGLACKHCVGQAGCGRYFPSSVSSLSQTTTSQTIMNHVRNCRRCPAEIRNNLELMKRAKMGPDGKRADKPKHGGRKVFFNRLWCRIQRKPLPEDDGGKKRGSGTWSRKRKETSKKTNSKAKKRKASKGGMSDEEDKDGSENTSEETETEEEESEIDTSEEESDGLDASRNAAASSKSGRAKLSSKKRAYDGCVRLTKADDPHWLSEMQCFVRSDMVEVFSHGKKESLEGYNGRKDPDFGQVGIRCVFCKTLPKGERISGCVAFPESLSSIHTKVTDMIRLHFPSCPAMPDDVKATYRSLRGFGAKADDDSQQYWIDAARDIGLGDVPPGSMSWGVTFRRDPLQPSPADELDRETAGATTFQFNKSLLVRAEDKELCTDHVMLLLRQVKACRFKKSDRRGGPGARGRDRVMGFPGLCCKHCSSKNSFGRYFPVSAKNLTDNTANSLQAHVSSCSRCPEPIKASLAYLVHRSQLQKAELSGSWKKAFFKQVWDRLHHERAWTGHEEGGEDEDEQALSSGEERSVAEDDKTEHDPSNSDTDEEDLGEEMADLVKAAAVWLSEQDSITNESRGRGVRGRTLPGKRPLPFSRGGSVLPSSKKKRASPS